MKKEEEEEERGKVSQCYDVVMVAHTTRPINEPHPTLKKAYLDVTQGSPTVQDMFGQRSVVMVAAYTLEEVC